MSEFNPLAQARHDASPQSQEVDPNVARYHEWVGEDVNPAAAGDLADYLENRPEMSRTQSKKLEEARNTVKNNKKTTFRNGEAHTYHTEAGLAAQDTVEEYNKQFANARVKHKESTGGAQSYDEMDDHTLIAKLQDAERHQDRTTIEDIRESLVATNRELFTDTSFRNLANLLASAEHEGTEFTKGVLSDAILNNIEAYAKQLNDSEEEGKEYTEKDKNDLLEHVITMKEKRLATLSGYPAAVQEQEDAETPRVHSLDTPPVEGATEAQQSTPEEEPFIVAAPEIEESEPVAEPLEWAFPSPFEESEPASDVGEQEQPGVALGAELEDDHDVDEQPNQPFDLSDHSDELDETSADTKGSHAKTTEELEAEYGSALRQKLVDANVLTEEELLDEEDYKWLEVLLAADALTKYQNPEEVPSSYIEEGIEQLIDGLRVLDERGVGMNELTDEEAELWDSQLELFFQNNPTIDSYLRLNHSLLDEVEARRRESAEAKELTVRDQFAEFFNADPNPEVSLPAMQNHARELLVENPDRQDEVLEALFEVASPIIDAIVEEKLDEAGVPLIHRPHYRSAYKEQHEEALKNHIIDIDADNDVEDNLPIDPFDDGPIEEPVLTEEQPVVEPKAAEPEQEVVATSREKLKQKIADIRAAQYNRAHRKNVDYLQQAHGLDEADARELARAEEEVYFGDRDRGAELGMMNASTISDDELRRIPLDQLRRDMPIDLRNLPGNIQSEYFNRYVDLTSDVYDRNSPEYVDALRSFVEFQANLVDTYGDDTEETNES